MKQPNARISKRFRCPNCNHHKMWDSRGLDSMYFKKCSRCGTYFYSSTELKGYEILE